MVVCPQEPCLHNPFYTLSPSESAALCLLQYLRANDQTKSGHIAEGLTRELSEQPEVQELLAVLSKLIRLPCRLPEPAERALAVLPRTTQRALTRQLLSLPQTPLTRIQLAAIFLEIIGDLIHRRLGRLMLRVLIGNMSTARDYLTFIRWSLHRICASEACDKWDPGLRLAAAWVHGDHIFAIAKTGNFDISAIADHLTHSSSRLQALFKASDDTSSDIANPNNLDAEALVLLGLAHAWSSQKAEEPFSRDLGSSAFLKKSDQGTLPAFGIFAHTATALNRLHSFLAGDRLSLLEFWLPAEEYKSAKENLIAYQDEQVITSLEGGNCESWISAAAVFGHFPPRPEFVPRLEKAILSSDFVSLATDKADVACIGLSVATSLAGYLPIDPAVNHLGEQLDGVARSMNSQALKRDSFAFALLESALNISRREPDILRKIDTFSQRAARLALAWPFFGETIRPFIQQLCEELPLAQTTELWRLTCRLRTQR